MKELSLNNIEIYLTRGIKIILFIIPLIPLYVSPSMLFPFITGKNFAFRILVELAVVLWIVLIALKREYRISNSPILLSILVFVFIVGLADLAGINPHRSFWSDFERMEGYVTLLHLLMYFMMLKSVLITKKDWQVFFLLILTVSVLVSLYPLIADYNKDTLAFRRFAIEYGSREFSTLGNPPFLAAYLLLASFVGMMLITFTKKSSLRAACCIAIIVNCAVMYLSASRGAILAAVIGFLILMSFYIYRGPGVSRSTMLKRSVLLLVFLSLFASGIFYISSDLEPIKNDQAISRFVSMASSDSVRSRLDVWEKTWKAVKEMPMMGWGQENFIAIYTVNRITSVEGQVWLDRAHNIILKWLLNAGTLGLLSYLAIFCSAFYVLRKVLMNKMLSGDEAMIIFTALVAYFFQNLFNFDTISTYIIFFALLAYIDNCAIVENHPYKVRENRLNADRPLLKLFSALLAALLCFGIIFYYINYKPLRQARQIVSFSLSSPKNDSYTLLLNDLNEILSYDTVGNTVVRKSMLRISNKILSKQHFAHEGAMEFLQATVNELRSDIPVYSYDLEYMTEIINMFYQVAQYDESFIEITEELINRIMTVNPEYHWLNMVLADVNVLKKNYDAAFYNIKKIVDLDPSDAKKQFKLALVSVYSSRGKVLEQAMATLRKIRVSKDKNIVQRSRNYLSLSEMYKLSRAYSDVERYVIALKYLIEINRHVSEEDIYFDQDVRYYRPAMRAKIHLETAKLYLKLNDKESARKEAEKALKINPALASAASALIDSIYN